MESRPARAGPVGRGRRRRASGRHVDRRTVHARAQGRDPRQPHRADAPARRSSAAGDDGPRTFVSASAVGYYGFDRGDALLCEDSLRGDGFLADVVADWEAATAPAAEAGLRVVTVRTGIVQAARGGTLKLMRPLFAAGLGGRLGSGRQWLSWIGLDDLLDVYYRALYDTRLTGPGQRRGADAGAQPRLHQGAGEGAAPPGGAAGAVVRPAAAAGRAGRARTRRGRSAGGPDQAAGVGPPLPAPTHRRRAGSPTRARLTGHLRQEPADQTRGFSRARSLRVRLCGNVIRRATEPRPVTSPSRSSASHSSSSARSSSGWNCSASARPSTNACDELAVRAISTAPGGSVQRSKCHWNHGPPGTRSGLSLSTSYQPISGVSDRATDPPNACASSWPPKQTPSVGTPASAASRTSCISAPTQVRRSASSYTGHRAPSGTMTS